MAFLSTFTKKNRLLLKISVALGHVERKWYWTFGFTKSYFKQKNLYT